MPAVPAVDIDRVAFDPRVELFSILYYLAGAPEYQFPANTPYRVAVEAHFRQFVDHPAVAASVELRDRRGISHDAPFGLAVYLDPLRLNPIIALDRVQLDPRWQGVALDDYLAKVRDFAAASQVFGFLDQFIAYTSATVDRLVGALHSYEIRRWFDAFLGRTSTIFTVVPGLLVEKWSYDVWAHHPSGRETSYLVVALEDIDDQGLPRPSAHTIALIVHEMAHTYVNPVVERHLAELEPGASRLYELVREAMDRQAYTSTKLMVEESIVRALTILYLHTKVSPEVAHEAQVDDVNRAFLWMPRMIDAIVPLAAEVGRTQVPLDFPAFVRTLGPFFEREAHVVEQLRARELHADPAAAPE